MSSYYRNRYDRVDQDNVPESKHTIFIRGLPGHIKTDEIKDFFEDHIGPCSFDFIKLSQDQLKLFVAVRFETREAAKECMYKYKDNDILGYTVELTWFKDIRRYLSYQQNHGGGKVSGTSRNLGFSGGRNRSSYERSSRIDRRDDEYDRNSRKRRERVESEDRRSRKSRTRSSSLSKSRSRSSGGRSQTAESIHSEQSDKEDKRFSSRSHSPSVSQMVSPHQKTPHEQHIELMEKGSTPPLPPSPSNRTLSSSNPVETNDNGKITVDEKSQTRKSSQSRSPSPVIERKSRKSKREKRKRKRKTSSASSASTNESTGVSATAALRSSDELSEQELRRKILKKRAKALRENKNEGKVNEKLLGKWEEKEIVSTTRADTLIQNTMLKFGLDGTEDVPKRVYRENIAKKQAGIASSQNSGVIKQARQEFQIAPMKSELESKASSLAKVDDFLVKDEEPTKVPEFNDKFKSLREPMQKDLREEADDFEPSTGILRISSIARQFCIENERERKLTQLPPEMLSKFEAKKKSFEAILKGDCETFAFVTKTLIQKNPALSTSVKATLADVVRDMEEAFEKKIDQYLDHLINVMKI